MMSLEPMTESLKKFFYAFKYGPYNETDLNLLKNFVINETIEKTSYSTEIENCFENILCLYSPCRTNGK